VDENGIQSVDRAIDLLLAVAAAGPADAGVPALAKACGLNRATAWRLLKTLQARRMVTVDESGRYALGVTAVELGGAAGPDALIAAAHPVLERTCARDRRDGVAGHARRRRAHLRRRGHPRRRAHGELAGPHRATARHVDGEGAARVPARG
jgi:DNA-binding IclR family transcriptional regulator